jgi:hypothetical protein
VDQVRVGNRLRRLERRKAPRDVSIVFGSQAHRSLAQKPEHNPDDDDAVDEGTRFRIRPRRNDRHHRHNDRDGPNHPPRARPEEDRSGGCQKQNCGSKPQCSKASGNRLRQLRELRQAERLRDAKKVNQPMKGKHDRERHHHARSCALRRATSARRSVDTDDMKARFLPATAESVSPVYS